MKPPSVATLLVATFFCLPAAVFAAGGADWPNDRALKRLEIAGHVHYELYDRSPSDGGFAGLTMFSLENKKATWTYQRRFENRSGGRWIIISPALAGDVAFTIT